MPRDTRRRDVLRGIGVAGASAGVAGSLVTREMTVTASAAAQQESDESSSVDALAVIGYPPDGAALFSDYYDLSDGSEDIIVPDGLRDGSIQEEVGNPMENVTGTAPTADGPAQDAFATEYKNTYDDDPGIFTPQSYDAAAVGILANVAAGENSGMGVRDQMRNVANPDGLEVTVGNFIEGVETVANGDSVNYQGASSDINFDKAGDPANAAYEIWEFDGEGGTTADETLRFEGDSPDGAGSSADSIPGGTDRTVEFGVLLPETGFLGGIGQEMIKAAELPVQQVNDSDLTITVNTQVEDTNSDQDTGIQGAKSLVDANVPFVCGAALSGVNILVCKEVLIPNEVVGCSPSSTALSVTNLTDDDYIFRTAPSDFLQSGAMAKVAAERLGADSAATLYVDNDYGRGVSERFSTIFEEEYGGTISVEVAYNQNEDSYTTAIREALGLPMVADYANEDNVVDTVGLREGIDDWRAGDIETDLLREVIDYWRSGEPVG